MTEADLLLGRIALAEGRALAGFFVELRVGATTQTAVTDGNGEFRLEAPQRDRESAAFVVRAPNNQIVLREWHPLDGRYLGMTVAREALPHGAHQGMRPPPPPEEPAPTEPIDVGDEGEVLLPGLLDLAVAPGASVVGVGDRIAVASGARVWIWRVEDGDRVVAGPLEVGTRSEVLDLAGKSTRDEIVLLLAGRAADAERNLAVVDREGSLKRRLSLEGSWNRLAVSPAKDTVALVADGSPAWASVIDRDLRIHELESPAIDVAFAGELTVLATSQGLLSLSLAGEVLDRTEWPGQRLRLVPGDPTAVVVYDIAAGRATRVLVDPTGRLTADATILIGPSVPFGWWWDRSRLVALVRDRLHWWRLPKVEIQPSPPRSEITWFGPT
jgi:hypothetical protein